MRQRSHPDHPNSQYDAAGWWAALRKGGFDRRVKGANGFPIWLYYKPGLRYKPGQEFVFVDRMGRRTKYIRPFDCTLDPESGKIEPLCVQALDTVCALSRTSPNGTWNRTIIRNVAPKALRASGLPYIFVPKERRDTYSLYTVGDKVSVVFAWIFIAVPGVFMATFLTSKGHPSGKDVDMYLPLVHGDRRFPLWAIHLRENRWVEGPHRPRDVAWSAALTSSYRALRPKYLYYLTKGNDGSIEWVLRPVKKNDITPYVFMAYTSEHYGQGDGAMLLAMALHAAVRYFLRYYRIEYRTDERSGQDHFDSGSWDLDRQCAAFWIAQGCLDSEVEIDDDGMERRLDPRAPNYNETRDRLGNEDTYSISDIIRGAVHVNILVGNPMKARDRDALMVWGRRVWTLAEVVLSQGQSVTVQHSALASLQYEEIPKTRFPSRAWGDPETSRQLIENYDNLHLSRLELVKVSLDCLMSRKFVSHYTGDRIYAMMSLLRIRPPIDTRDSSFQAFARLSFPQDSDRLMERLICLLPDKPDEDWELMTDQYRSSLWSIHPNIQVSAVGENDTVVVDGAKGAQIQWSSFGAVRTTRRVTALRQHLPMVLERSPLLLLLAIPLATTNAYRETGIALAVIAGIVMLAVPALTPLLFRGKLYSIEPCFFGVEGYVPLDVLEGHLFGKGLNRMRWSPFGSPISRHCEGEALRERAVRFHDDPEVAPTCNYVDTFLVEPIDPCSRCTACADGRELCQSHETPASCAARSRSSIGDMKVFTLVDTFSMTATLFLAARPPTALVVCGTEGGMQRAVACSLDVTTGTLYRETVLRIPSRCVDHMASLDRVRIGLRRPFLPDDVELSPGASTPPAGQLGVGEDNCLLAAPPGTERRSRSTGASVGTPPRPVVPSIAVEMPRPLEPHPPSRARRSVPPGEHLRAPERSQNLRVPLRRAPDTQESTIRPHITREQRQSIRPPVQRRAAEFQGERQAFPPPVPALPYKQASEARPPQPRAQAAPPPKPRRHRLQRRPRGKLVPEPRPEMVPGFSDNPSIRHPGRGASPNYQGRQTSRERVQRQGMGETYPMGAIHPIHMARDGGFR